MNKEIRFMIDLSGSQNLHRCTFEVNDLGEIDGYLPPSLRHLKGIQSFRETVFLPLFPCILS